MAAARLLVQLEADEAGGHRGGRGDGGDDLAGDALGLMPVGLGNLVVGRAQVGGGRDEVDVEPYPKAGFREQGEDVVLVMKARMHHHKACQALTLLPTDSRQTFSVQPTGSHERRKGGQAVKDKIVQKAQNAHTVGAISEAARSYLVDWGQGTRRRAKRPDAYEFLHWRHQGLSGAIGQGGGHPEIAQAVSRPGARSVRAGGEAAKICILDSTRLSVGRTSGPRPEENSGSDHGELVLGGEPK